MKTGLTRVNMVNKQLCFAFRGQMERATLQQSNCRCAFVAFPGGTAGDSDKRLASSKVNMWKVKKVIKKKVLLLFSILSFFSAFEEHSEKNKLGWSEKNTGIQ